MTLCACACAGAPAGEEYPSTAEKRQRADDSDVSAKKPRTDGHDEITVVIECPHVKVGLVIGKAGSVLKELHEITGATVKVAPWDEVSVMRVVQIKGSPQAIAKAKTLVGEKTGVPEESMPLLPDRPEAFNASARHSQGASRGQPIARSFLVPNEHVGAIIGKQGLTLKEFRETSKAQIQARILPCQQHPFMGRDPLPIHGICGTRMTIRTPADLLGLALTHMWLLSAG